MGGLRILAVAAALVATAGLTACGGGHARPAPSTAPTSVVPPRAADNSAAGAVGADLVVGDQLRPLGGSPVGLPGSGTVYSAHKLPDGWLVERGDKGMRKLWLVTTTGSKLLVDFVDNGYSIGADGRHLAYQQGNWLTVGVIGSGKVIVQSRTQLPGKDGSQGRSGAVLTGWAGEFLVIGNRVGVDYEGFDVWDPSRGGYSPTFNKDVYGIFGAPPAGGSLLGAVAVGADRHPCLASLDPSAGLRASNVNCAVPVHPSYGWLSPDARHLAAWMRDTFTVYELASGTVAASVPYQGVGVPTWIDGSTVVVPQKDKLIRLDLGDPKHPQELPLPDPGGQWLVVARIGN